MLEKSAESTIQKKFQTGFAESISLREKILQDSTLQQNFVVATQLIVQCLQAGGGLFLAGNGGSAADAQHIAAEFVGRFYYDRPPLRAEALSTNSSDLTCIGNDYGFEFIFERALRAKARPGDVFIGISTSGNSPNILRAARAARENKIQVISLTGASGGKLLELSDVTLQIPSTDIPRIQECHITVGHLLCELVERAIFPQK